MSSFMSRCHIGFLLSWKREREEREKNCCLVKQPFYMLKFRNMRLF
uniref:Uncharacterized protein n=1 Tax=Arundo donax TaxID=35708 RepID=A0A0A9FPS0_ARUDO